MKTAVVVAAWNEEGRVGTTLQETKKYISTKDIIVVSDGSTDNTEGEAKKERVHVIGYQPNKGKGNAMRVGCDYAFKSGYEAVIVMDADGQHEPKLIPKFIRTLEQGNDIVFGNREGKGAPLRFKIGNFGLSFGIFLLSGVPIKDTQSGYRAFTQKAYQKMRWQANDYFVETEMIMRSRGLKKAQFPIKKIYLDEQKGTTVKIGLKIGCDTFKFFLKQVFGLTRKNKY